MHSVLRNFVDAARGCFLVEAEQLVQGASALADGVGLLDGFGDVNFRQNYGVAKLKAQRKLRGNRG